MTATKTHLVPFMGDTLNLIDQDGEPFIAVKPICVRLGLHWTGQHAKLTADPERWGIQMILIPSMGGAQETTCLPMSKIFGWLATISPSKVAPEARDILVAYQKKCDEVLYHYWMERLEDQLTGYQRSQAILTGELIGRKPSWGKFKAWIDGGLTDAEVLKQSTAARWRTRQALADMRAAGLIPPADEDFTPMERLMGMDHG